MVRVIEGLFDGGLTLDCLGGGGQKLAPIPHLIEPTGQELPFGLRHQVPLLDVHPQFFAHMSVQVHQSGGRGVSHRRCRIGQQLYDIWNELAEGERMRAVPATKRR